MMELCIHKILSKGIKFADIAVMRNVTFKTDILSIKSYLLNIPLILCSSVKFGNIGFMDFPKLLEIKAEKPV